MIANSSPDGSRPPKTKNRADAEGIHETLLSRDVWIAVCFLHMKHIEGMLFGVQNKLGTRIECGFDLQAHLIDKRSDHRSLFHYFNVFKRNGCVRSRLVTIVPLRPIACCRQ